MPTKPDRFIEETKKDFVRSFFSERSQASGKAITNELKVRWADKGIDMPYIRQAELNI